MKFSHSSFLLAMVVLGMPPARVMSEHEQVPNRLNAAPAMHLQPMHEIPPIVSPEVLFAQLKAKYQPEARHDPIAMRELGRVLIQEGKTEECAKLLINAWNHGDIEALTEYGKIMFKTPTLDEQVAFVKGIEDRFKLHDPQAYFIYGHLVKNGLAGTAGEPEK